MTEEYLTKCVVDPLARKFYLYSSEGSTKEVHCESINQFIDVLGVVRGKLNDNVVSYSSPL